MKASLQDAWRSKSAVAYMLWPLSLIYAVLISLRTLLYRLGWLHSDHAGVATLVIGNVVAGGAGKTPLVMALLTHFNSRGIRVGVISRGYGRSDKDCREVFADTPAAQAGDEPALIKKNRDVPVFVAQNRLAAARALLAAYPRTELIICDDGLQHYALQRDIEIVVFDDGGLGNGWLIPAGPLREHWPRQANLVLHTGRHPAFAGYRSTRQLADQAVAQDGSCVTLQSLRGERLVALAGIANPSAFFEMLEQTGLKLEHRIPLDDHHDFSAGLPFIAAGSTVLCTEKDAIKLFELPQSANFRLLSVALVFEPEPAFMQAFDALLDKQLGR
ncbi:Tetraacyldisaccharide 4'-kinase [Polaromonas vacuolata]|uniref:Tetraacyldisaccharide 4'-kinase n=1 Tax=Polaromonas vacuolata TaxID=37448 RepID=A0A6H2HA36_9BURK|nr:tetraacyldisaccharide 4'-kinase [Polaromonas vacuolata]QJC56346.1 Tetraacyldisaccharide 4'-kinase [Polaromonas vacuolata]